MSICLRILIGVAIVALLPVACLAGYGSIYLFDRNLQPTPLIIGCSVALGLAYSFIIWMTLVIVMFFVHLCRGSRPYARFSVVPSDL